MPTELLGASDIRRLASQLSVTPTKKWGQNFVIDPNTVRRIVEEAHVLDTDVVLEVGPGLGSLTLALLDVAEHVVAVEIDSRLAEQLPKTVLEFAPHKFSNLSVINHDALTISDLPSQPTKLVANLPYNISVPVILYLLERFPSIQETLVMVQAEVGERLAARPGSKIYGVPSVKATWYADVTRVSTVSRRIFWPEPNVDSVLIRLVRHHRCLEIKNRDQVFAVVDAAFGQRRKTLRAALSVLCGGPQSASAVLEKAQVDSRLRGEQLDLPAFIRIASAMEQVG